VKKPQKAVVLQELKSELSNAVAVVVAEYKGITVESLHRFRVQLRGKPAKVKVVKNTLLTLATKGTSNEALAGLAGGPIAIIYSQDDPSSLAKEVSSYAKKEPLFVVRGGTLGGKVLDSTGVEQLSTMPSLGELRAKLLGLLTAPAQQFLSLLQAPSRDFLGVLDAKARKQ